MSRRWISISLFTAILLVPLTTFADLPASITVDVNKPGIAISPMLYGLMTEEINHSYDGGLYAELIQNRSFQDNNRSPAHWSAINDGDAKAELALDRSSPVNASLPVSLRVTLTNTTDTSRAGVANDGYWGIPVKPNTTYTATFYAKSSGNFTGPLTATLESADGQQKIASATTENLSADWKKYTLTLKTAADITPSKNNRFVISASHAGTIHLSLVSLFPPTFNNRPNGSRIDIMQTLDNMKPSFLRMPGGNYVEGDTFPTRFNWKEMIGSVDLRPGHMGCWSYRSSDGFGMPEFLGWCDDLKMEPLLAVFAGYTLRGDHVDAGPKLQPYVDEALEEIEYCIGAPDTPWGQRRAADGHPAPFNIHYIEIGNEDFFDRSHSYDGRFAQFYDAIKAKYPQLQIIATTPVKSRKPDIIDDHFYRSARQMEFDDHHYDKTDRNGPKIFVGEWATTEGRPTPNLRAALADTAWLMGLERNSDLVIMSCYAPLLVNVNRGAFQWNTNLVGYDALNCFGSTSYYAQLMINQNRGDVVLPTDLKFDAPTPKETAETGAVGLGSWHTSVDYQDFTVTDPGGKSLLAPDIASNQTNWKTTTGDWKVDGKTIHQTSTEATECFGMVGDPTWTDYTIRVKAKKNAGGEGFMVLLHARDTRNFVWWNVGGWNNTRTALEISTDGAREQFGPTSDTRVETGKWYDLRLEIAGKHIRGFIDDKLVTETDETPISSRTPLFAESCFIKSSNEAIVKIVNASDQPVDADIHLAGAKIQDSGKAIVLAGASGDDTNTIETPAKVAPHEEPLTGLSDHFHRLCPPLSFTLLRIKATPE